MKKIYEWKNLNFLKFWLNFFIPQILNISFPTKKIVQSTICPFIIISTWFHALFYDIIHDEISIREFFAG